MTLLLLFLLFLAEATGLRAAGLRAVVGRPAAGLRDAGLRAAVGRLAAGLRDAGSRGTRVLTDSPFPPDRQPAR